MYQHAGSMISRAGSHRYTTRTVNQGIPLPVLIAIFMGALLVWFVTRQRMQ